MNLCSANSHMFVPLQVLTLRTSLYTCIYTQVCIYIYHITDTFVYDSVCVQANICLCPCECSHLEPLCIHTLKNYSQGIHISYYRYFRVWLRVVRTHLCLCPCECSHLEPLCIHAYTHKHTYVISQIPLYMNPCYANSHMSVPLRVLALRTSLHTYIRSQVYICSQVYNYILYVSCFPVYIYLRYFEGVDIHNCQRIWWSTACHF